MSHIQDSIEASGRILIEDHGYTAEDLKKMKDAAYLEADKLILEDE